MRAQQQVSICLRRCRSISTVMYFDFAVERPGRVIIKNAFEETFVATYEVTFVFECSILVCDTMRI